MSFGLGGGGVGASGPKNNTTGVGAPAVTDDSDAGYSYLSEWIDTSASPLEYYKCLNAAVGAAQWVKASLTIDELGSMAVQNANNVVITGGTVAGVAVTPTAMTYPVVPVVSAGASTNMSATASRTLYHVTGTLTQTLVLPENPAVGTLFEVRNSSTGAVTIAITGADLIDGAASFVLATGDFFGFEIVAANTWIVRY